MPFCLDPINARMGAYIKYFSVVYTGTMLQDTYVFQCMEIHACSLCKNYDSIPIMATHNYGVYDQGAPLIYV